ncbi:MAG: FHA domain-containing protein [Rhodospirillales bacterium]|nr:FHA domain-containing protein [Rhodospirillales bacterium]
MLVLTQRETIRFLAAAQELWLRQFPALHRRAQWHLASHLAVRGREGAALGELYGLVKQIFLLDDATVRERVSELRGLGLCVLDPEDGALSARSVVLPTAALLERYDAYLRDIGARLLALGTAVAGLRSGRVGPDDAASRQALLRAIESCQETLLGASERVFDDSGLSRARRLDARRHLMSVSHGGLLLIALERQYGLTEAPDEGEGVLADQMAASLLGLIRQNFQTTRDHIAYLVQIGLLERRPGRALRVAVAEGALAHFDRALEEAGADLARQATELAVAESVMAAPGDPFGLGGGAGDAGSAPRLLITGPGDVPSEILLGSEPVVIGRAPGAGVLLPSIEVSRAHCRIAFADGAVSITDLNSTNGTFIDGERVDGAAPLPPGAVLRVGPYRLTYADPDAVDGTMRADRNSATLRQRPPGAPE